MQKKHRSIALTLLLLVAGFAPAQVMADPKKLEEGATVRLKLLDAVSSGLNHEGDNVALRVVDDVMSLDESTVLIKAGTPAWGTISGLEERGRIGAKGKLSLAIEATKAVDGKKIRLRASMTRDGKDQFGTVMALSFIVCPLFLFMRGKDATVPAGTQITTYVDRDMMIEAESRAAKTTSAEVLTPVEVPAAIPSAVEAKVEAAEALDKVYAAGLLTKSQYEAKKRELSKKKLSGN